jgi:ribonuclease P protein subunit POP4
MHKTKDFVRHELIGLNIKIVDAGNPSLIGVEGKIIDESKNSITIETKKGIKKLIKSQIKMRVKFKGKTIEVNGKLLVGRPEDRIKKIRSLR